MSDAVADLELEIPQTLAKGYWRSLPEAEATAPLAAVRRRGGVPEPDARPPALKPVRKPKDPVPRARSVNPATMLEAGQDATTAEAPSAPTRPAPAAPAAAPQLQIADFAGGADTAITIPPDPHMAVSPTHVFSTLNDNIYTFDKTGTLLVQLGLNAFWSGQALSGDTFDPKVLFDPSTGRFYFVTMADAERATSRLLIAVSDTGDPNGTWRSYAVGVDPAQGSVWMDFPSIGYTADKITVQVNLFTLNGNRWGGSSVYAFDKAAFVTPGSNVLFQRFDLPNQGGNQAPAITLDPNVNDQYLCSSWAGNAGGSGYLALWSVTGSVATNSAVIGSLGNIKIGQNWGSRSTSGDLAPQKTVPDKLDAGDDRMQCVVLRHGKLYGVHTIYLPAGGPNRTAVQWHEITVGTWATTTSRLDTAGVFRANPSLAVNGRREVLLGYSSFKPTDHPSGACALIDGAGGQAEVIFAVGQNTYAAPAQFASPKNRWGDYSAAQVDPEDDAVFWTIQSHAGPNKNEWATRIARVSNVAGAAATS